MKLKLLVPVWVLVFSILVAAPVAAAPAAGPCASGATYDPACDVNHDGVVNVLDVQLTAGHWNQSGAWTGGGEGWLLNGNAGTNPAQNYIGTTDGQPLVIQPAGGNVGIGTSTPNARFNVVGTSWFQGDSTPLPLAAGKGIAIGFSGEQGYIYGFDYATWTNKNLIVQHAGGKVAIGTSTPAQAKLTIAAGAEETGVVVSSAGSAGVYVGEAGGSGVVVSSAGSAGVYVEQAGGSGVLVGSAYWDGVYANSVQDNGQWGFYTPDAIRGSNVLLQSLSLVAQVAGPDSLTPGDVVAVAGVADPVAGSTVHTPLVRLAGGTFTNVVGVVESHLALTQQPDRPQPVEGQTATEAPVYELRSTDGPALAGDYVAITVLGAALVKVQAGETVLAGQRLTVAANGRTRPVGTIKVQLAGGEGTADIAESAPVIGVALEAAKEGLVWVLVNPQ
ncbi:MAG TPA: hypothetical protein VL334_03265 [Anaerolineae bacterium]|nr:hypothetical protein [Anaerolineae bacterium]